MLDMEEVMVSPLPAERSHWLFLSDIWKCSTVSQVRAHPKY